MKVFKNKYGRYETLFKGKDINGNESKYYMLVSFRNDNEPTEDSVDIIVKDWWGTAFKGSDGTIKPKLFINKWEYYEVKKEPVQEVEDDFNYNNDLDLSSDNLPFY